LLQVFVKVEAAKLFTVVGLWTEYSSCNCHTCFTVIST